MGDEVVVNLGANAKADLRGRAEELAGVLDDIAELQDRAKEIKADAKSEGYDMKAFNQIVKERRRGPDYQADQLQLEMVLDTYRTAVGLPTDLATAQEAARKEAGDVPEPKREKRKSAKRREMN